MRQRTPANYRLLTMWPGQWWLAPPDCALSRRRTLAFGQICGLIVIAANPTNADTGRMPHPTRTVACLVYPGVMSLDVVGPMQVFGSANAERTGHGLPPAYALRLLAGAPGPVTTSAGFALVADGSWADTDPAGVDTVLVAGGDGVADQLGHTGMLQWLRHAEPQVRRLGSVCSGALLLAEAGLLDGLRVTTHWCRMDSMRQNYPAVQVDEDCLHTYDAAHPVYSHLFTSAGVTAGIDLALALVEADLGRPMALAVARRLVMFMRRPGGQAQFSALLAPETRHAPGWRPCLNGFPRNWAATCRSTPWPGRPACRRARSPACSSANWAPRPAAMWSACAWRPPPPCSPRPRHRWPPWPGCAASSTPRTCAAVFTSTAP